MVLGCLGLAATAPTGTSRSPPPPPPPRPGSARTASAEPASLRHQSSPLRTGRAVSSSAYYPPLRPVDDVDFASDPPSSWMRTTGAGSREGLRVVSGSEGRRRGCRSYGEAGAARLGPGFSFQSRHPLVGVHTGGTETSSSASWSPPPVSMGARPRPRDQVGGSSITGGVEVTRPEPRPGLTGRDGAWSWHPGAGLHVRVRLSVGMDALSLWQLDVRSGFGWMWQGGGWNSWNSVPRYTGTTLSEFPGAGGSHGNWKHGGVGTWSVQSTPFMPTSRVMVEWR